ncbi:glucose 1-dehydrogenase [Sporosarcina sp. ACRSL]|uniref:SDR family NAD(P)-dependent oxidoreductase n=1 Tax=Sporosarcina sp. ACRSL TaxID=2918215 RepID=UPI001EF45B59|nr:glucose 1-dehydrogenase [Sporosarcina sp. ACRSL]MCG7344770.1 glucose 1-dehydrogenase [Sporosarcina sp. ACRSL]
MGRLSDKVAIITGGASGMGAAEAYLFAKEGAKVVVTDLQEELLQETVKKINDEFGEVAIGLKQNVANEEEWNFVVEETIKHFGKIDILVNNAGIGGSPSPNIEDFSWDDWESVINVNAGGTFLGIKAVVPEMKKNQSGSIINISSIAALMGGMGGVPYTASKGATRSMTKVVALDLAKHGIRVNSVHPGVVDTPLVNKGIDEQTKELYKALIPLNFLADSMDIAYPVLFLASDESRFMTGAELVVDGGTTIQ